MGKFCTEWPELVELCMKCAHVDCVGEDGCKSYQEIKNRLENRAKAAKRAALKQTRPRKPEVNTQETQEERVTTLEGADKGEVLRLCNSAIAALEALCKCPGCGEMFPTRRLREWLDHLKELRIEVYSAQIDWDTIAEGMKRGRGSE